MNSRCFKLYRASSISFTSSNVGKCVWSWILKDCIKVQEKERNVFPSSTEPEFRHFHVVVEEWRQRNVQKKGDACMCKVVVSLIWKALFFRRSSCHPRLRCLSSVISRQTPWPKNTKKQNSKSVLANLVLVKFTAFKLFFSLALKCDNHKTDEDVDHEKGDNYDIYYVVDSDPWTVVLVGSLVRLSRVNWIFQNTVKKRIAM